MWRQVLCAHCDRPVSSAQGVKTVDNGKGDKEDVHTYCLLDLLHKRSRHQEEVKKTCFDSSKACDNQTLPFMQYLSKDIKHPLVELVFMASELDDEHKEELLSEIMHHNQLFAKDASNFRDGFVGKRAKVES